MATTNTTLVNFVKVPTTAKFNDIDPKVDGTIYFIVDAKKIYLDGIMYGFNSSDIDLSPFLKHDGTVSMTGNLDMDDNDLNNVGNLTFVNNRNRISPQDATGGLEFYTGSSASGKMILRLAIDNTMVIDAVSIEGIPTPIFNTSPISKEYLEAQVINKKGVANGFASLDESGLVPSTQLPSYVDDILEYAKKADFPATGETGKLYVDLSNNYVWRWSGSAYVNVSDGNAHLTLGTTSSTAFQGDLGKEAHDHALLTGHDDNPHNINKHNIGLENVWNYGIATQTDAEDGESNELYMTPQRTAQAIAKLAPKLTWTVVE